MKRLPGLFLCLVFVFLTFGQAFAAADKQFEDSAGFTGSGYLPVIDAAYFIQTDDGRCKVGAAPGNQVVVRSEPNGGKIVRRLKKGTVVYVVYEMNDPKNHSWSKFALSNKDNSPIIGWVLTRYLRCT